MGKKDVLEGAKIVGDAASAKFEEIKKDTGVIREKFESFSNKQTAINEALIDHVDEQEDRLKALEDNRYFVRMSRHRLDDMTSVEQERLAAWLQKLVSEMQAREFLPNENQQAFLSNIFKNMGLQDEFMRIDNLSMLETFGDSSVHEVIYKIFLITCYLYNNSFSILPQLDDIDQMFKLNASDKVEIRRVLEQERIPTLGIPGLVGMFDPGKPLNSFKIESLISLHTDLNSHHMLQYKLEKDNYEAYLKSFAILTSKNGKFTENQRNFIVSLAKLFGCPECVYDIDQLCLRPQNVDIDQWQSILDTDEKKYAWILDGATLLSLDSSYNYEEDKVFKHALRGLKMSSAQEFVFAAIKIPHTKSPSELLENIVHVYRHCKEWKHVADFCGLSFKGMFDDLRTELISYDSKALQISIESTNLNLEICENRYPFIDLDAEGFFEKIAMKMEKKNLEYKRACNLNSLLEIKRKTEQLSEYSHSSFTKANFFIDVFGIERIDFNIPSLMFENFELDHSAENEEWSDDFDHLLELIEKVLDSLTETAELLEQQLALFEQGKIHTSNLLLKKEQQKERDKEEQAARDAKRIAKLNHNGGVKFIGIEWQDIRSTPFDPSDISSIASSGSKWMVLVENSLFFSDDGEQWTPIVDRVEDGYYNSVKYINNTWILYGYSNFLFSKDGVLWEESKLPEGSSKCMEIYFFNNQWLLILMNYREYTYKEKGLVFDSDSTGAYEVPTFYWSKSLAGGWEKWDDASSLNEGVTMINKSIASNEKLLVTSFCYDWGYSNNKKKAESSYVAYISGSKKWERVTWPQEKVCGGNFYFIDEKFFFLTTDTIFTSMNGYEWSIVESGMSHDGSLLKIGDILFIPPGYKNIGYVSKDGINFSEIIVSDYGRWSHFAANEKEIIAVFAPSMHETFLRKGILSITS